MNRYKLVLAFLTGLAIFLGITYLRTPDSANPPASPGGLPATRTALQNPAGAPPGQTASRTEFPTSMPAATTDNIKPAENADLQKLLAEMENLLPEIEDLLRYLNLSDTSYEPPNQYLLQTYQPQIDKLQARFSQLAQQASSISRPRTQRFLWEQLLGRNLDTVADYLILGELLEPGDALLEEMLVVIASPGYDLGGRENLIYHMLFPNRPPQPGGELSARQQRIKAFIEQQLPQETDSTLMIAYLEAYSSLMDYLPDGREAFQQHLDAARLRMDPDQYFSFKLQQLDMQSPQAGLARLLQEMDSTPMNAEQRERLLSRLGGQINAALNDYLYNPEANTENPIPEANRQLLVGYLERNLSLPRLKQEDNGSLYQYGDRISTIEMLRNGKQIEAGIYQRIVSSNSFDEQVALLLVIPGIDGNLPERLQGQPNLKQSLLKALADPQYSAEDHQVIGMALANLTRQTPPPEGFSAPAVTYDYDVNGNAIYTQETFPPESTITDYPATEDGSGTPDGQYPDY